MLKKLIKYDFKAIFKYWWIAAVASTVLAVLGGICLSVMSSEKALPDMIYRISTIGLVLVCFGFVAFVLASVILIIRRYYTNLFTDEGYLTFTLPVKKHQIINSKLITAMCVQLITAIVCLLDVVIMICVGFSDYIFSHYFIDTLKRIWSSFAELFTELGFYTPVYVLEVIMLMLLGAVFSTLFIFCCVTFASVVAKKARIIKAIAIYYLANSVLSFILQIFMLFGTNSIARWYSVIPENMARLTIMLTLLTAIFFIALICALIYALQYRLIDKKLNLS